MNLDLDLERSLSFDIPRWDRISDPLPTRFEKVTALDHGTWVIVNDKGQFFSNLHCYSDEWDNITGHGTSWTDNWDHAHVFHSKRTAELRRQCLPRIYCETAVVG